MKKGIVLGVFIFLAVGLTIGWGPISEVGAKISDYFADDPDMRPGFQGEFDEADYIRRRDEFVALLRGVDPTRPADPMARTRANELMDQQKEQLSKAAEKGSSTARVLIGGVWLEIGPKPIPNGQTQTTTTPVSGRVTAIAVDPSDATRVYVGTAQGGIYRSLDGGATWSAIFDNAQTLAIGCLTIDGVNNRLWVGTGEANGSADSFAGVGVYRIDNPATTATLVGPFNPVRNYTDASSNPQSVAVFTGRSVSKILVSPADANTLIVGSAGGVVGIGGNPPLGGTVPPLGLRGLYRLDNMGGLPAASTATRVAVSTSAAAGGCFDIPCTANRNVNDMVLDPQDSTGNTLIVWLNGINAANDGGIWRSTNVMSAAPTFTQTLITTATTTSNGRGELRAYVRGGITEIYTASGEPSVNTGTGGVTLCNLATNLNGSGALRRSDDGGQTWSNKLAGGGGFCAGQCFYNIAFDVVPGAATTTDKLLLGGNVRSTSCAKLEGTSLDGGATVFANTDVGLHADSHVIKVAPSDASVVYRGDDGGIWKSTDGGATWASLNNTTFSATQFQSIAMHPTDLNITLGGTQDNGTELMGNGQVWTRSDAGDGGFAMIDQTTPATMYHTYFNQTASQIGYARSTNSGASWSFLGCTNNSTVNGIACAAATTTGVNFYAPTALGPASPNNVVYIGTDRLLRSATQGTANVTVSQAPIQTGVPVSTIGISPQDDNYRIVGLNNGALWFTTTGSSTLTSLDPVGGGSVIPDFYVSRAVFDPTNKNTVYLTLGNFANGTGPTQSHLWKITNLDTTPVLTAINGTGGNILPDVPINGFAVDPGATTNLYVGTDIGVFASLDGGANWAPFGTGLPRVAVFDMAIHPVFRVLRIATHGRGMWQLALVPTAANVSIGGRVTTQMGSGISNANVILTDSHGVSRSLNTGSFGYFHFDDVLAGETYIISVNAKRYRFSPQVLTVNDAIDNLEFMPNQ